MSNSKSFLLCGVAAALIISCTTTPSSPFHTTERQTPQDAYHPEAAPVTYQTAQSKPFFEEVTYPEAQPAYTQNANYNTGTSSHTGNPQYAYSERANTECLKQEQNRKIAGAAIGGAIGAYAGKKLGGDDNKTLGMLGGAALGGTAGYGIADKSLECDPVIVATQIQAPQQAAPYPASSQEAYYHTNGQSASSVYAASSPVTDESLMYETGGQNLAYYEQNVDLHVTDVAANIMPDQQEVNATHTYASSTPNTPHAPASLTSMSSHINTSAQSAQTYIVQEDDTAYRLSKNLCTTPHALQELNNLDGAFLIKAGEAILLPESQC